MRHARWRVRLARLVLAGAMLAGAATPAWAGPPYLTDDPVPTDLGKWEIYAFTAGEGHRSTVDADAGVDLNYGPVPDVQLTATVPLSFSHAPLEGWSGGSGDLELGVKYRFLHRERAGFSAAVFPRVILPTAAHTDGERARLLLPVWLEQDFAGGTSVFGGGGWELNPGPGERNFWQAGVTVTQTLSERFSAGAELTRQGADTVGGTAQTRAGLGGVLQFGPHRALLVSGGPTWADHRTGYHFYASLGLFF